MKKCKKIEQKKLKVVKVGAVYYVNVENKIYINKIGKRKIESCVKINGEKFFAMKKGDLRKLGFEFPVSDHTNEFSYKIFKSSKIDDILGFKFSNAA